MPLTVELRENGHVLYCRATDPLPVHEFKAAFIPQQEYLDQAKHKLHILVDLTQHKSPPPGAIASARQTPVWRHPNSGEIVVIGASAIMQALTSAITRLTHFDRLTVFPTEAKAWDYLRGVIKESQVQVDNR
jgi:hypothetical protein